MAELRERWARVQTRLRQTSAVERYDLAAAELREMLAAASEHIGHLSERSKAAGGRYRRRLKKKTREIEAYLHRFEVQMPSRPQIRAAEAYVKESLLAGYEDLAIRYVAKRRRFNAGVPSGQSVR